MKPIYALFVGIDNYPAPVDKLSGTVNDVNKIKSFLEKNYADRPLHIKTLLNEEATYDNFISAFRNHLGQAGKDDVVWFHYSGHGSRQPSAQEFEKLNSGKKDETIVLYDSRPNGYDFADKEIAVLLSELSAKKPHILVTYDCCHSGSGTREVQHEYTKRLTGDRSDTRPMDTYLKGYYKTRSVDVPDANYIFFAACGRYQTAKESFSGGGLFTENLINVLNANKELSYDDLFVGLRQGVIRMKWDQDPELEPVGDTSPNSKFLDGNLMPHVPKYAVYQMDNAWTMDAGNISGIDESIKLSIYDEDDQSIISNAKVIKSLAISSIIDIDSKPDVKSKFWARPLNLPPLPYKIGLSVDKNLEPHFLEQSKNYFNVGFDTKGSNNPYQVVQSGDAIVLKDTVKNIDILSTKSDNLPAIDVMVKSLDQIGKWNRLSLLQNNKCYIDPGKVNVYLEIMDTSDQFNKYPAGSIDIKTSGNKLPFKLWVQNVFTQPLNFALMYMSDHYMVKALKNEQLEKSDQPTLFWGGGEDDYFEVPDGLSKSSDIFKLIISTERVDVSQFELEEEIEFGEIPSRQRAIPGINKPTKVKGEWWTMKFVVNLTR